MSFPRDPSDWDGPIDDPNFIDYADLEPELDTSFDDEERRYVEYITGGDA